MAAAAAVMVAGAAAQDSISYTTVTYDTCPSVTESLVTVTNGVTVTYCPLCDHNGETTTPGPTHTTVYTTTYLSLCPTGIVPETYTVTETCHGPEPTWNTESDHIPQDFTVTVKTCSVCDSTPVPVTITEPCGCKAHEGTVVPQTQPQPKPTGDNAPPAPTGGNNPPPAPTDNRVGCPGPDCKGGDNTGNGGNGSDSPKCPGPQCQAGPTASGSNSPVCPGPQCQAGSASGSVGGGSSPACSGTGCPAGSASGTSGPTPSPCSGDKCKSSLTPYTGAASSFDTVGVVSSLAIAAIAALAFGL